DTSEGEGGTFEGEAGTFEGDPSPRRSVLPWLAILLLALSLRLPLALAGFPYINYVDEGHVLHPVVALLQSGSWDPKWHLYPSLPFYAIAGAVWVWSPIYSALHGQPLREGLSPFPPRIYDLVAPAEVLAAGRLVTLGFSLGVVLLTGLLARRVTGSQAAGLFAALAAALVPALVIRGGIATVDPFTTFFTVAAVYFAEGAVRGSRPWRDSILAGLTIGCALTSKYTGVLVCLPVAVTLLRMQGGWRYKARAVELAALASLIAAAVTMPALVLKNEQVLDSLARHAMGYQFVTMGSYWEQAVKRAEWDHPFEHPELGLPFLILAALGWVVAMWDCRTRGTAAAWTLYAAVVLALFTSFSAQPFRNLLPLVPVACVLVAIFFAWLRELRWRPLVDAAAAVLLLALFLPAEIGYARERARLVDSRVEAVEWLARHRRPDETLLIAMELPILPSEAAKLPGKVLVMPQRQAIPRLIRRRDVQMVVTGIFRWKEPDLRKALNEGRTRARYRQVATFGEKPGTGIWRGNRQRVLIYRRVARNEATASEANPRIRPSRKPGGANSRSMRPTPSRAITPR
ncbi:MAG TPA: glycosyltransferase family 39 protein, partial [Thermoanaerobaculia bacterium]